MPRRHRTDDESTAVITLQVGSGYRCAIQLEQVAEVLRPLELVQLSGTAPWVSGLARVRGLATPVVDLRTLLGVERDCPARRWVLLRIDQRQVALAVDDVLEVRTLPQSSWARMPGLLQGAGEQVVAAVGELDQELLVLLKASRAVTPELWQALAEQETAGADGRLRPATPSDTRGASRGDGGDKAG